MLSSNLVALGFQGLPLWLNARTRSVSAENPKGEAGEGPESQRTSMDPSVGRGPDRRSVPASRCRTPHFPRCRITGRADS